nr:MAG TPA: hypothetical protein [Bacteriophage sp.]
MFSSFISTTLILFCMFLQLFGCSRLLLFIFCWVYSLLSLLINIFYVFFGSFQHIVLEIFCKLSNSISCIYIRQHPIYILILLVCIYNLSNTLIELTLRPILSLSSSMLFCLVFIAKLLS